MRQQHRVEVLRHERDATTEAWSNADGSVRVQRFLDAFDWSVELDGRTVMELERHARDHQISITSVPMASHSLQDLAVRLALQRRVHLLFDA